MRERDRRSPAGAAPLSGVKAIVTDAETRLGLYVIRSLGRAGCRVTAVANKSSGSVIGFSSRYAAERIRLPEGEYWETLPNAVEEHAPSHDLLMPISAFSIAVVATASQRLDPLLKSYIPDLEAFKLASDKRATTEAGRRAGVAIPRTYPSPEPAEVTVWAEGLRDDLPLVVKFSDDERSGSWAPSERYRIVRTVDELAREYLRMHGIAAYPLVQEYVEGDGFGFFTVMGPGGETVGTFCHHRLREYPVAGGPSTLCESYHDPELVRAGTRLLEALDWRGVAMVEFKQNQRTGEYKLLEINPRFWGPSPWRSIAAWTSRSIRPSLGSGGIRPPPPPMPRGGRCASSSPTSSPSGRSGALGPGGRFPGDTFGSSWISPSRTGSSSGMIPGPCSPTWWRRWPGDPL